MEALFVPALHQAIVNLAHAGVDSQPLAAPLAAASARPIRPHIALAASLTAAACVGTHIVSWLRPPAPGDALAIVDADTAGVLLVGFVSGDAATRWLPAIVVLLAVNAMLAPGLVGGSRTLARGTSVDVDRVVKKNGHLLAVTRDGFRDAAAWYREERPGMRFRVT